MCAHIDHIAQLARQIYTLALSQPTWSSDDIAGQVDATDEQIGEAIRWLAEHRLVDTDMRGLVRTPRGALWQLLTDQEGRFQALTQAQAMLSEVATNFLTPETGGCESIELRVIQNAADLRGRLEELHHTNRYECLVMLPNLTNTEQLRASLAHDLDLLGRGISYRLLLSLSASEHPVNARYISELYAAGAHVRVAGSVPLRLLLLDRETAVARLPGKRHPCDVVIHNDLLAEGFRSVFEHVWSTAATYGHLASAALASTRFDVTQRQMLRLLAAGGKDAAIARQLGCSERTVRRLVSEILRALRVDSRFAAGARAAQLGLLD